ncbi:MAG: hypothetical protein IKU06_08645 [Lachnospiraceae bacterium]|nr:hypothetical protein [Lachnospiraceae bacterium]
MNYDSGADTKKDLSGYEVVREDYIADPETVQLNLNKGRIYINSYGLSRFPDEDYVRILVNDELRSLVIKPYKEKVRASYRWCGGKSKRKARHVRCLPLFYLIYKMMQWDINARYRITGEIEEANGERVIYFDLEDAVCFIKDTENGEETKYHMQMPKEWEKQYGMPVMDFEKRQDIRTFQDMAVFDVEFEQSKEIAEKV